MKWQNAWLLFLVGSTLACGRLYSRNEKAHVLQEDNIWPGGLGMGWDSWSETYRRKCAEGDVRIISAPAIVEGPSLIFDIEQLSSDLGAPCQSWTRLYPHAHALLPDVCDVLESGQTHVSLIFRTMANLQSKTFASAPQVSAIAEQALTLNQEAFLEACGDHYVERVDLGALHYVQVNIHFPFAEQKKDFLNAWQLPITPKDLLHTVDKMFHAIQSNPLAVIEVIAGQRGANQEKFSEMMESGVLSPMRCGSVSTYPQCKDFVIKQLSYAGKDFAEQIDQIVSQSSGKNKLQGDFQLIPLKTHYKMWSHGQRQYARVISEEARDVKRRLLEYFQSQRLDLRHSELWNLSWFGELEHSRFLALRSVQERLKNNLSKLNQIGLGCRRAPENCELTGKALNKIEPHFQTKDWSEWLKDQISEPL